MVEASESEGMSVLILSLAHLEYYDPDEYNFNKTLCEDCDVRVNSTEEMMLHFRTWDHYYEAVHSKRMVRGMECRIPLHPDEPLIWIKEMNAKTKNHFITSCWGAT